MLRTLLIYLSQASWARRLITSLPLAWPTASRFVAGEQLEDAVRVVKELNARHLLATLDVLGEHTLDAAQAEAATNSILAVLDAIDREGIVSGVSLKLTQIGLDLDREVCARNLSRILGKARTHGIFVRIDMEDSSWVDVTLELFREMQAEHGLETVGVVLQSYLYRSEADLEALLALGARVRLCKGAYLEPPEIAYPKKADVDANYDLMTERLVDRALDKPPAGSEHNGRLPPIPAIATHDELRILHARNYAEQAGLPKEDLEFQMLYGIRRELQDQLRREGYPVRIYVPFGTEWYPYFMRRLAERPANLWFFLSNLFKR
jgi:proline dehydrogenase